jgi:N-acetylneuraminate synthase
MYVGNGMRLHFVASVNTMACQTHKEFNVGKYTTWVAEIGINHNGNLKDAFALIDLAKKHGFDYVKFQKRDINSCYTQEYLDSPRESPWGNTQRAQKMGLEFSMWDYKKIDEYCQHVCIEWFYSPWDLASAKLMYNNFPYCDYVKIAKACANNKELADFYNENGKAIIISCNAHNTMETVETIKKWNNLEYALNCVSLYPSPPEFSGLGGIALLEDLVMGCEDDSRIGFSNHSPDWIVPVIASHKHAAMIEVHITLDKNGYGSDQKASLDDADLTMMMKYAYKSTPFSETDKYLEEEKKVLSKLRQTW